MQDQIYKILSSRSGKPLRQIIRDTKRTDFYLDATKALEYGLIDAVLAGELPAPKPVAIETRETPAEETERPLQPAEAARETRETPEPDRTDGPRLGDAGTSSLSN